MAAFQVDAQSIFDVARRINDDSAQSDYLQQACGDNVELRQRIEGMLKVDAAGDSFFESPPPGIDATIDIPRISEKSGDTIGPYKLLQKIGEGGFGVVYMAEQIQPVRRKVALKIIKPGMDTKEVIARFEAERQALALMDHPNIAKVFDAGATDTGRPYFVMELVKGSAADQLLRREPARHSATTGVVCHRLYGRSARSSEGHHSSRPETIQCDGDDPRQQAGPQSH